MQNSTVNVMYNTFKKNGFAQHHLALADLKGVYYFLPEQIIRLEAINNYTRIYFNGLPPFTASKVLKVYEALLKPFGFIRTHRSHLVNKQFIRCVESDAIIMQDESVVIFSRRMKSSAIKQIKN